MNREVEFLQQQPERLGLTTARFYYNGIFTGLLNRIDSLQRKNNGEHFLPNALFARGENGQLLRVTATEDELLLDNTPVCYLEPITLENANEEEIRQGAVGMKRVVPDSFDHQLTQNLKYLCCVSAKPYADNHVMFVYLEEGGWQSNWTDINSEQRRRMLKDIACWTEIFLQKNGNCSVGANVSFCIDGKGLRSVLVPHPHVFSDGRTNLNFNTIKKGRTQKWNDVPNLDNYDHGLAQAVGSSLAQEIKSTILPAKGYSGDAAADQMGALIDVTDFNPQNLTEERFAGMWRLLSSTIDHYLKKMHEKIFASCFDDVANYIIDAHKPGFNFNKEVYDNFFKVRDDLDREDPDVQKMLELYNSGLLRNGFGWSWAINFQKDRGDAVIGIVLGFANRGMGPVEALGIQLTRNDQMVTPEDYRRKSDEYKTCLEEFTRNHYPVLQ